MTIGASKWGAALIISAAIHAGAAGWFYQSDNGANIAGGSPVEISLLGDAFQNETVAGDPSELVEPIEPEVVDTSNTETTEIPEELTRAEIVEPTASPSLIDPETTATIKLKTIKIVDAKVQKVQVDKAEPVQQAPSEPIAFAEAEPTELLVAEIQLADINIASLQPILLSEKTISPPLPETKLVAIEPEAPINPKAAKPTELSNIKTQPADIDLANLQPVSLFETTIDPPLLEMEPVTPDEVKPENSEAETFSPTIEKIEPQEPDLIVKPEEEKVQEKKKASKKPIKKKTKKKRGAGSDGKGKRNTRAGDSKGSKTAKQNATGKSRGKKSSKNGNASTSNYKGKVRRKVKRSFRRPRGGGKSRKDAVVRFVLSTSGAVRSVRLVRSSGSKKLDQAALSAVRRASPFPKPPGSLRGAKLNFTLPFGT